MYADCVLQSISLISLWINAKMSARRWAPSVRHQFRRKNHVELCFSLNGIDLKSATTESGTVAHTHTHSQHNQVIKWCDTLLAPQLKFHPICAPKHATLISHIIIKHLISAPLGFANAKLLPSLQRRFCGYFDIFPFGPHRFKLPNLIRCLQNLSLLCRHLIGSKVIIQKASKNRWLN